uniref:Sulfatase N-terminal domain-containing protein n=1 Tax=Megaselia scalaris TaxID=36166 RepID=T1GLZ0_MEGSC
MTAYAEDVTWMSTFNYVSKGFKDPPTDHYFRPYFQSVMSKLDVHSIVYSPFCISYKHGAEYAYDYMMDFVKTYKGTPYFGLFWANSFSHDDPNLAFIMDERISKYMGQLEEEGIMEESVILFLADHGLRFGAARHTEVGGYEENLPMLNIWIPPKLRTPEILENIRANQKKLINPYDVYHTMFDVLRMSGYEKPGLNRAACLNCTSIFKPMPATRKCRDIGIPSQFCACKDYTSFPIDSNITITTAAAIVNYMNGFKNTFKSSSFSGLCKNLSLGKINGAHESTEDDGNPNKNFVVSFETEPNKGQFEVTLTYQRTLQLLLSIRELFL